MATITLFTDTLISALMPSGGGSLASGDTIQLAGHSLIVDADAVDYPVTIANSGEDANLELRDLGRIKLNATLPANVHPWIDRAHPLPVSAEPGIDGDPYRTSLTANARAEIQLNGNFGLGGGVASLPTATRGGAFYSQVTSSPSSTQLTFGDDMGLHVGDKLAILETTNLQTLDVTAYDSATRTVTLASSANRMTVGDLWGIVAGGVCINHLSSGNIRFVTKAMTAGTLVVFGPTSGNASVCIYNFATVTAERLMVSIGNIGANANGLISRGVLRARQIVSNQKIVTQDAVVAVVADDVAAQAIGYYDTENSSSAALKILRGRVGAQHAWTDNLFGCKSQVSFSNFVFPNASSVARPINQFQIVDFDNCTIGTAQIGRQAITLSGSATETTDGWLFAPATAEDIAWRYTDRVVAPGATLRLRCAWFREGTDATRASVAVTDPATWWPQLWPLGAEALASVEFTGGTADWRSELLSWRNTGTEAATVRVWECVTGTPAGGYLKVEEVKGGAL